MVMFPDRKKWQILIVLLIIVSGVLPLFLHWQFIGQMSTINIQQASTLLSKIPFRESPVYEQWVAVISAYVVKPAYMSFAFLLILVLWRQKAIDLAALRWGLIFFLTGETFCAINYLFFGETSQLAEYLHSFGMAICMGLVMFAVMEGVDHRLVKYSDPTAKCAFLGLCRGCVKYKDMPCAVHRLFMAVGPMLIILAVMPLNAVPLTVSYNTNILGTLYNYTHAGVQQLYEIRFCPLFAIALFAVAFLVLFSQGENKVLLSKIFLAAGLGHLGFSFFRLALLAFYQENMVWFVFWEEMTELIFVVSIGLVLWIFRDGLLKLRVHK